MGYGNDRKKAFPITYHLSPITCFLLTIRGFMAYIKRQGGVAQVVRACGSYPQCPGFKSLHRHFSEIKRGTRVPMKCDAMVLKNRGRKTACVAAAIFMVAVFFVSGLFFCAVAAPPEKKAKLPLRKTLESLTTPTFRPARNAWRSFSRKMNMTHHCAQR